MIKRFEIIGLHGKQDFDFNLKFNSDLNIFTGKNGSGKTTVLKFLWYCLSGNVDRIRSEIVFTRATMETDSFNLVIAMNKESESKDLSFHLEIGGKKILLPDVQPSLGPLNLVQTPQQDQSEHIKRAIGTMNDSSVFFPTFRRIEGGYASERRRRGPRGFVGYGALQEALSDFSESLDIGNHHFVASISTLDIVTLLTSKYAEISQHTNQLQQDLSKFIIDTIRVYETKERGSTKEMKLENAQATISQIQIEISEIEKKRELLLRPFAVLGELVDHIFTHRGIKVTDAITLGLATESITSDKLSAGEKQMLSFLCYNAFSSNSCVFIDEPEISLHVDWQRTLFPTLLSQSTSNQFIIATHSPFIYSKYADKELVLNPDKGDK
ncbi:MAG TPA: AAA family ATPase [Verrucomicrobiae bacterium]|nr:AAA family ATPase [Verrucomicrobiae bacterium]